MLEIIFGAIEVLCGDKVAEEIGGWMGDLLDAVVNILKDGAAVSNAFTIFSGVAVALLTIYFFLELYNNVSREMFTIDRLVVSLIKFFVACAILICLQDIVTGIAQIGKYSYLAIRDGNIFTSPSSDAPDLVKNLQQIAVEGSDARKALEEDLIDNDWDGIWALITHFDKTFILCLVQVLGFITSIIGRLVCVGNAISILVYAVMSPIAVVNLFEEGSRSAGIRYLKKFAATCLTMAIIIVTLQAASALETTLLSLSCSNLVDASGNAITQLTASNINIVLASTRVASLIIPQLATISMMAGCAKISADILGA